MRREDSRCAENRINLDQVILKEMRLSEVLCVEEGVQIVSSNSMVRFGEKLERTFDGFHLRFSNQCVISPRTSWARKIPQMRRDPI